LLALARDSVLAVLLSVAVFSPVLVGYLLPFLIPPSPPPMPSEEERAAIIESLFARVFSAFEPGPAPGEVRILRLLSWEDILPVYHGVFPVSNPPEEGLDSPSMAATSMALYAYYIYRDLIEAGLARNYSGAAMSLPSYSPRIVYGILVHNDTWAMFFQDPQSFSRFLASSQRPVAVYACPYYTDTTYGRVCYHFEELTRALFSSSAALGYSAYIAYIPKDYGSQLFGYGYASTYVALVKGGKVSIWYPKAWMSAAEAAGDLTSWLRGQLSR